MTKQEAIQRINSIERGDIESAHGEADDILIGFLDSNGFADIAAAYRKLEDDVRGFWYA